MKKLISLVLCIVMFISISISSSAITVVKVSSIKLDKASISLSVGKAYNLKVTFTPANTTQNMLRYTTSNGNVATVDAKGKIKAVRAGKAVITATSTSNSKVAAKCNVTVTPTFTKPIRFGYATLYPFKNDDFIKKEISGRFNVTIDFFPMGWDNYAEKTAAWLASGDMPDTMMMASFKYPEYKRLAQQGVIKALPTIDDRFPSLKKMAERMTVMNKLDLDGKTYAWPRSKMFVPDSKLTTMSYYYRKDWAKALGYNQNVFTIEEFIKMCKDMAEKDPGKVGKDKVIPFNAPTVYVPSVFGLNLYSPYYNTYKKVNGKYVWGAALPETIDGIKLMQRMYKEGVLSKDFYTQKADTAAQQFASGQLGVFYENATMAHFANYYALSESYKEKWGVEGKDGLGFLYIKDKDGKIPVVQESEYWAAFVFSPKVKSEKMERIMYVMDWLASEEGMVHTTLGIKGKDWEMVGGEPKVLWKKDVNGNLQSPSAENLGMWFRYFVTNGGDELKYNPSYTKETVKAMDGIFNLQRNNPVNLISINYDLSFLSSPLKDKFGSYQKEIDDQIIKLVISSDNIERDWKAWINSYTAKVEPILAEINKALSK